MPQKRKDIPRILSGSSDLYAFGYTSLLEVTVTGEGIKDYNNSTIVGSYVAIEANPTPARGSKTRKKAEKNRVPSRGARQNKKPRGVRPGG